MGFNSPISTRRIEYEAKKILDGLVGNEGASDRIFLKSGQISVKGQVSVSKWEATGGEVGQLISKNRGEQYAKDKAYHDAYQYEYNAYTSVDHFGKSTTYTAENSWQDSTYLLLFSRFPQSADAVYYRQELAGHVFGQLQQRADAEKAAKQNAAVYAQQAIDRANQAAGLGWSDSSGYYHAYTPEQAAAAQKQIAEEARLKLAFENRASTGLPKPKPGKPAPRKPLPKPRKPAPRKPLPKPKGRR